ncbi:uncharacterized protein BJ212DRAFT_1279088, partial [Suillus subaureus]
GLKAELLQQIVQFFDGQPELKRNQRYKGLFNAPCSRRQHVETGNNTTESVLQDTPSHQNSMHAPFGSYQPQPIPQPSMSHMDLPPPSRYAPPYYPMHHSAPPPILHFAPAAGSRADFQVGAEVQMYDVAHGQPYSGPYHQYTHNNYMNHDT